MKIFYDYDIPEKFEDEVFLTNSTIHGFGKIEWFTKRFGNYCHDQEGNSVNGLFPIFVKKSEIIKAGFTIISVPNYTHEDLAKRKFGIHGDVLRNTICAKLWVFDRLIEIEQKDRFLKGLPVWGFRPVS